MSRTKPLFIALILAFVASGAFAQDWRGLLKMVDNDLQNGDYAHARKWSIKLINSMSDHLGTGEASAYTMSLAVAYRALAEKGLDKPADADWYWHVATSMYPAIATRHDWTTYGDIGAWAVHHTDEIEPDEATVVPVKKVEPKCPLGAIQGAYYQPIHVAAIVDGDGVPRCPTLLENPQAPTLEYAAFEALRQWQFQTSAPAKYELTIDFQPPKK